MSKPRMLAIPSFRWITLKAIQLLASKDSTQLAVVMIAILLGVIATALIDGIR
jgi:hypothetical protein